MEINGTGNDVRIVCSLDDVKEMYRALFRAMDISSGDVDTSDALSDIQEFLHAEAIKAGVNLANHSEWDRFLGKTEDQIEPCEVRYAGYRFGSVAG